MPGATYRGHFVVFEIRMCLVCSFTKKENFSSRKTAEVKFSSLSFFSLTTTFHRSRLTHYDAGERSGANASRDRFDKFHFFKTLFKYITKESLTFPFILFLF